MRDVQGPQGPAGNLARVKDRIERAARQAGRDPSDVGLVAVSKIHPASAVRAAFEAGQRIFGESYVQEALGKQEELSDLDIRWHLVGGLQSNKAKFAAGRFELIHSVDSAKLAGMLDRKAGDLGVVQDILLQVDMAGEAQKCGAEPCDAPGLAEAVLGMEHLRPLGLMTLPPFDSDPEKSRRYFAGLRELRDQLAQRFGMPLPHLSMGMTGDFVQAIEEGATLVRVGTAIFGPRPGKAGTGGACPRSGAL